ncbi:MAG: Asp-tRNA(Asn)/Glu-tRNA(Gln) amidotransferase subunit GatA [Sphingobacteriales bacterium]|nr:Asp-tRNA(Asn)/Glu-tRNA(Gln) amidotransferase subunit GatA [Sphingobacteriales bacterium]OJW33296.1 MAG: glutaminyl-tRNA synthase (glutamine-hydrolyzing) subunit A [Sphingobacteriales bacterium 46-32]
MFSFSSIDQYHSSLQDGTATCLQAVEHYLQRINAQMHLNAFVDIYADEARTRAAALDLQRQSGRPMEVLHGVVIGIKDVIAYNGHKLTAASRILEGFHSIYSATAVERLLEAGAIIIGSLNCDEFAMGSTNENSAYGKVLNALDETRIPGGSSGGSAVAVQAGLCMVSLGSDTGGSVRQPADLCGIIGLKPTYGRISRYGLIAYASSFDQIGIFGSTIADVALTLQVMAGADDFDSTVSTRPVPDYTHGLKEKQDKPLRIAYFPEALDHPSLDPEISQAIHNLLKNLQAEGHQVSPVSFSLLDHIVPAYYVLTTAEASSNLSRYDGVRYGYRTSKEGLDINELYETTRSEAFGTEVKRRIMLGTFVLSAGYYDAYYTRAQKVRKLLFDQTQLIFKEFDHIFLPTTPSTAFRIGEKTTDPIAMYLADIYTVMANLVGIPAISLPLFRHSNGMPFGLQVMSNRFEELSLLRISDLLIDRQLKP